MKKEFVHRLTEPESFRNRSREKYSTATLVQTGLVAFQASHLMKVTTDVQNSHSSDKYKAKPSKKRSVLWT